MVCSIIKQKQSSSILEIRLIQEKIIELQEKWKEEHEIRCKLLFKAFS